MGKFKDEGNILVLNQSNNVLVNYNFMLRVEGIYDLPCKSVHSFTKENEFEYVQEGGLNDYVHMLRKPVSKPFSFTVERYVGMDIIPPLPLGAELVLPVILMVAPNANQFDKAKRTFVFTGCTVMSKTYGELNAEKSGLLTETIVIGYREMTEVTVPVHMGSDGKLWKFDGANVEGNGERSANTRGNKNGSVTPRRWMVEKGKETTSVQSARKAKTTVGPAVARKWPTTQSAKQPKELKGQQKVRQWLIPEGQEETSVQSARKAKTTVGPAVARKWPTTQSAKQPKELKGEQKVRQWLVPKGQEETSVQSARKPKTTVGPAVSRKWKPTRSAKQPEKKIGDAVSRKWKPTQSAKQPEKKIGDAVSRKWKPTQSAKQPEKKTGDAVGRKWKPTKSAKQRDIDNKET